MKIEDRTVYREMLEPFKDDESANKALRSFFLAVYKLRCEHKIANVSIVISDTIEDTGPFMGNAHFGSSAEMEAMAAFQFGKAQAERKAIVDKMLECGDK